MAQDKIISQNRHELPRNIKTIGCTQEKLLVFYENCDSLDIFFLGTGSIKRVQSFFWVDPNTEKVSVSGQDIYLRGASYVKQIRLKSRYFLET